MNGCARASLVPNSTNRQWVVFPPGSPVSVPFLSGLAPPRTPIRIITPPAARSRLAPPEATAMFFAICSRVFGSSIAFALRLASSRITFAPFRSARRMAFLPRRSGSNFSLRSISASPFTSTSNCIVIRSLTDPFAQLLARRVRTPAASRPVPDPDPFHPRKAFQADHGLIFVQAIWADALPEQPVNVIYAKVNRLSRRIGQHRQALAPGRGIAQRGATVPNAAPLPELQVVVVQPHTAGRFVPLQVAQARFQMLRLVSVVILHDDHVIPRHVRDRGEDVHRQRRAASLLSLPADVRLPHRQRRGGHPVIRDNPLIRLDRLSSHPALRVRPCCRPVCSRSDYR